MIYLLFLTIMINTLCLSSNPRTDNPYDVSNPSQVWRAQRFVQYGDNCVVDQESTRFFHLVHTNNATIRSIGHNELEIEYTEFKEYGSRREAMIAADGSCC